MMSMDGFSKTGRSRLALLWALLFLVVTGLVAARHEPWFDEAQGWLLARDSGLWELIWVHLRYEGSPGLWHLLLWVPAHVGAPFATATGLAVVAATISCWLLVRYSPFPVWVRVMLPFSFYLGFQYAVVARSYALFPPLLAGIAILYPNRHERPMPFFVLLGLLANVSAHGILVACGIAAVHVLEAATTWRRTGERPGRSTLACYGGFALLMLLLSAVLWPPADLKVFTGDRNRDWLRAVLYPLSDWPFLSVFLYLVSLVVFWRKRTLLLFAVTWGPVALLFAYVFRYAHDGLLFLVWLLVMWVSLDAKGERTMPVSLPPVRHLVTGLVAVVLVSHLFWYGITVKRDWTRNYSAAKETARFLADNGVPGKRVYGWGFGMLSILPYFDRNIFYNYRDGRCPCYWHWSKTNPWNGMIGTRRTDYAPEIREILAERPDIVVIGIKNRAQGRFAMQLDATPAYRMVRFFRGRLWFKTLPNPEIEDFCVFFPEPLRSGTGGKTIRDPATGL